MSQGYIIRTLDNNNHPDYLESVVQLWRKYSDTLGFFPEGAFFDYASRKQILIALNGNNHVSGYILYRVSKQKVSITHLCVDDRCRCSGLSRLLLDHLRSETKDLKGVGLFCRRDYSVNTLWPKLGFVPMSEKKGRGKKLETLTYWWLDYRNPTLFTESIKNEIKEKIAIVIDANVFYDLDYKNNKPESIESKAIDADWFKGVAAISVTDEIYTEINRRESEEEREYQRIRAQKFNPLVSNRDEVIELEQELRGFLRKPRNEQDSSDFRQFAHAISAKADYFITRDDYLLKQADLIYEKYNLNIRRPAEIILEVDNLYDEVSYRPARLAGTLASIRLVSSGEVDTIAKYFCLNKQGEKIKLFKKRLATILGQPDKFRVFMAVDSNGSALSVYATSNNASGSIHVCLARVKEGMLGSTLARYLLIKLIREASKDRFQSIMFSDDHIQTTFIDALQEEGFIKSGREWVRLVINTPIQLQSLEDAISKRTLTALSGVNDDFFVRLLNAIKDARVSKEKYSSSELERLIWPGKILDNDIPCYIVPIKPGWARGLFDEKLANEDLFGADLNLAIQNEGVYYYSVRGAKTSAPARILWYVSQDKNIPGSSAIRACSTLKEITVDTPKPLYKKYRRLGVYKWNDILKTANNDCSNKIVAMHFGQTELFRMPITWKNIQQILEGLSLNKSIISATPIPADIFMKIYRLGTNNNA